MTPWHHCSGRVLEGGVGFLPAGEHTPRVFSPVGTPQRVFHGGGGSERLPLLPGTPTTTITPPPGCGRCGHPLQGGLEGRGSGVCWPEQGEGAAGGGSRSWGGVFLGPRGWPGRLGGCAECRAGRAGTRGAGGMGSPPANSSRSRLRSKRLGGGVEKDRLQGLQLNKAEG